MRFVQPVHQKKARIKEASRELSHKSCHDGREQHTGASSAEIVLYVIYITERACFYPSFKLTEKTFHKDPFLPFGENVSLKRRKICCC